MNQREDPEEFDWDISEHSGYSYSGTLARLGRLRSGRGDDDERSHPGRVAALVAVVVVVSIVCMVIGIRS